MSLKTLISMVAVTLCSDPEERVPRWVEGTQPMATLLRMEPNAVLKSVKADS